MRNFTDRPLSTPPEVRRAPQLSRPSGIEVLEARIAPAMFFVSATSLSVKDAKGTEVNDTGLAATVDVDLAVKLAKGDSVVLDANDNHKLDPGKRSSPA